MPVYSICDYCGNKTECSFETYEGWGYLLPTIEWWDLNEPSGSPYRRGKYHVSIFCEDIWEPDPDKPGLNRKSSDSCQLLFMKENNIVIDNQKHIVPNK